MVDLTQMYQALQNGGSLGSSLMAAFAHPQATSQVGGPATHPNALGDPSLMAGSVATPAAQMTPYQQGMALAQKQQAPAAPSMAPQAGIDQNLMQQGAAGAPSGQKTSAFGQILKLFSGGA